MNFVKPRSRYRIISDLLRVFIKICGVSLKPTMLYPGTILYQDYDKFNKLYGTRKIETVFWNKVHAYPMHLSYDQAKYLSLLVERLLNNYEKYDVCRKTTIGYNNISEKNT